MTLKDFFNKINNSNKIYTAEDIGAMSTKEYENHSKAIDYQLGNLGIPRNSDLVSNSDVVYVQAYTRDDGTDVKAHYRSKHGGVVSGGAAPLKGNAEYNNMVNPVANQVYTGQQNEFQHMDKKGSMNAGEKVQNAIYRTFGVTLPLANDNLTNAMDGFSSAKKNENAFIIYDRKEIKSDGLNKVMNMVGIPKNARGTVYSHNSDASTQLQESAQIKDFIDKNYSKLKNNYYDTASVNFGFPRNKNEIDNFLGIQHATLYKPHIDKNGYFNAMVVDLYDFKKRSGFNLSNIPNNWGYSMQEKGLLENQFNLYYIHKKVD